MKGQIPKHHELLVAQEEFHDCEITPQETAKVLHPF
jgi:hypothetical protein